MFNIISFENNSNPDFLKLQFWGERKCSELKTAKNRAKGPWRTNLMIYT